ncbi:MAG: hypothetical protein OZ914_00345 [Anaerolineaceae bacterium]|jgi:hypothetical protein|nr:hypothetical protein [Anaerolineaceae bacterium]OQY91041.1 MAG: hypothetical protein B6D38_00145 [Anaerolineae bacterium UTCFX1]
MSNFLTARPPQYRHFVLLAWEERGADGVHAAWRFSLQDSQKDERIGFKDLNELAMFLEKWMKDVSESNGDLSKEKIK